MFCVTASSEVSYNDAIFVNVDEYIKVKKYIMYVVVRQLSSCRPMWKYGWKKSCETQPKYSTKETNIGK